MTKSKRVVLIIACCLSAEHLDTWIPFPDRFYPGNLGRILYIKQPYLLTFKLLFQLLLAEIHSVMAAPKNGTVQYVSRICITYVRACEIGLVRNSFELGTQRHRNRAPNPTSPPPHPTSNFTKGGPLFFSVVIYRVTMTKATVVIT